MRLIVFILQIASMIAGLLASGMMKRELLDIVSVLEHEERLAVIQISSGRRETLVRLSKELRVREMMLEAELSEAA